MKKISSLPVFLIAFAAFISLSAIGQSNCSILQVHSAATQSPQNLSYWFSVMELPFLFISVFFAFSTANALKGGKFGRGMLWLAWGFLVMAVGHLHMQIEHFYGFNLFKSLMGETAGNIMWMVALIITWGFSGLGFYSIYRSATGK
jgi:hypothetical protein